MTESPKVDKLKNYDFSKREMMYGIPHSKWHENPEENLFPCWKCRGVRPWYHFTMKSYREEVEYREGSHFQCCYMCRDRMCHKIIT